MYFSYFKQCKLLKSLTDITVYFVQDIRRQAGAIVLQIGANRIHNFVSIVGILACCPQLRCWHKTIGQNFVGTIAGHILAERKGKSVKRLHILCDVWASREGWFDTVKTTNATDFFDKVLGTMQITPPVRRDHIYRLIINSRKCAFNMNQRLLYIIDTKMCPQDLVYVHHAKLDGSFGMFAGVLVNNVACPCAAGNIAQHTHRAGHYRGSLRCGLALGKPGDGIAKNAVPH